MSLLLDTGAVIVGFQEACVSGDADRQKEHARQRSVFRPFLDAYDGPVIIPSVVFAEFLYGMPTELLQYASGNFGVPFRIVPLTTRVAMFAASIREKLCGADGERQAAANYGTSVNAFRADVFVMATYQAERCTQLVTRDRPMVSAATQLGMNATHLDDLKPPQQPGALPGLG
jgi:predicted nucleic acid-binding protein